MIHHQIVQLLNKHHQVYILFKKLLNLIFFLVDSIEEHFARSLAKFRPSNKTESVVDDHFAKALGATTWEKLKEKS
jgi:hypothetical protein